MRVLPTGAPRCSDLVAMVVPVTHALQAAGDEAAAAAPGPVPGPGAVFGRLSAGVTDAGLNGICESPAAGVPMVALPLCAEQPANAQRPAELGVALTADVDADVPAPAATCRPVLDDQKYRAAARGQRRRILGLPGRDELIADLSALAA